MPTAPYTFDTSAIVAFPDNLKAVEFLVSSAQVDGMNRPGYLQPVWQGMVYAAQCMDRAHYYEGLQRQYESGRTAAVRKSWLAMQNMVRTWRANAMLRLRGLVVFLRRAGDVAATTTPALVAKQTSLFFRTLADKISVIADSLIRRQVHPVTGENCDKLKELPEYARCRSDADFVGTVDYELPLPSVAVRSLTAPVPDWSKAAVGPRIESTDWQVKYPILSNGLRVPATDKRFLTVGYEQALNFIASVRSGKAKSIQDESLRDARLLTTEFYHKHNRSLSELRLDADSAALLDRLFVAFTTSWYAAGFGPWATEGVSGVSLGQASPETTPHRAPAILAFAAGAAATLGACWLLRQRREMV